MPNAVQMSTHVINAEVKVLLFCEMLMVEIKVPLRSGSASGGFHYNARLFNRRIKSLASSFLNDTYENNQS